MRSRSSSIALMSWPNSFRDPAITISSSVWLLPMHSNWKLIKLVAKFRCALERARKDKTKKEKHDVWWYRALTTPVLSVTIRRFLTTFSSFFFQKGDYIAGPTRGDLWSYAQLTVTVFYFISWLLINRREPRASINEMIRVERKFHSVATCKGIL